MEEINFREVMYGLGIAMASFVTAWGVRSGVKKSDGSPPEERQPSPHEIRALMGEVKQYLDAIEDKNDGQHRDLSKQISESYHQIIRQLDRIEYKRDQR